MMGYLKGLRLFARRGRSYGPAMSRFCALSSLVFLCFVLLAPVCSLSAMTLHLWEFPRIKDRHDPNDRYSWLRKLCRRFESLHPGVEVSITELTWRQGEDKLKIAVYAGAAPDIASGPLPLAFVRQGVVSPIDEHLTARDRGDYLPGALEAFRWNGRHWGWPWCRKCDALFLNLDIFRERGVEPPKDGRWTLEEFLAAARRLTFDRDGDGSVNVFGVNFCLAPGRTAEYALLLQPGGRLLSRDGTALSLAEDAAGLKGMELVRDLCGRFAVAPPSAGGAGPKDVWLSFFERRSAAIMPCGLWALKALSARKPFRFGLAHFPDGPDGRPRVIGVTTGYYVFRKPGEPEREDMAHELARFLTSGENQEVLREYGQFPTRASAGALYGDDPNMSRAARICAFAEGLPPVPSWPRLDELLKRNLQLAVLGELTVREAAARVSARARVILAADSTGADTVSAVGGREPAGTRPGLRKGSLDTFHELLDRRNIAQVLALCLGLALIAMVLRLRRPNPRSGLAARDERSAWFFLLPSIAVLGLFFAYPVFRAFLLAFQDYRVGQGLFDNFAGIGHFRRLAGDPVFRTALVNTAVYTAVVVPLNLLSGLVLASLIAPLSTRWRNLFRGAFYLPGVTSVVVLAMIWRWLYDVEYGLLNGLLLYDRDGAGWWFYQLVRNLLELPPSFPRLLAWAAAVAGLAVLMRCSLFKRRLERIENRLLDGPGAGSGMVGRVIRRLDLAAGGLGLLTFMFLSAGVVFLLVVALAAVPWQPMPVKPIGWLTSTRLSLFSIILSMLVRGPGGALIIYLAALESCPHELYEVAEIDGASAFDKWWHITLPLLKPTTLFLLVTQTIGSFQVFAQVSLLTDGGPGTSSSVLVHRIYTSAFRDLDFGYASAQAMVLFLIIAAISALQFIFLGKD